MENYSFMVECLKEFNYPQINYMEETEICEIFSTTNREFLVTWILKQINPIFIEKIKNPTKENLAELVYCNGFCSKKEKGPFMNGEGDNNMQLLILYKMFRELKDIPRDTIVKPNKKVSIDQISELRKFDLNLFPMYGPKKKITPSERVKKLKNYKEETEKLKKLITEKSSNQTEKILINPTIKEKLESAMAQLEKGFPDFKKLMLDVLKIRPEEVEENVKFPENFSGKLEMCHENATSVLEFLKSVNTILRFNEEHPETENFPSSKRSTEMIRELAELCTEITALKKQN